MDVYLNNYTDPDSDPEHIGWFPPSEIEDVIRLVEKYPVIGNNNYVFDSVSLLAGHDGLECWIDVRVA